VGNQDAEYFSGYRFSAETSADSTAQGLSQHYFQVLAHTSDPYTFWTSNTMSGHSVDNLAPTPPLFLTAERVGADVHLSWGRSRSSDVKRYAVYRRTSKGVKPIGVDFVSSEEDTVAVDAAAPGSALYYIVTAYDVHGNQSIASNEAGVSATS